MNPSNYGRFGIFNGIQLWKELTVSQKQQVQNQVAAFLRYEYKESLNYEYMGKQYKLPYLFFLKLQVDLQSPYKTETNKDLFRLQVSIGGTYYFNL